MEGEMSEKAIYLNAKEIVKKYESKKLKRPKVIGSSTCPFCGGTKTKPFLRAGVSQDCTFCNRDGQVSNRQLIELGLDDMIEKL